MLIVCISYTISLLPEKLHFIRLDITRSNHLLKNLPNFVRTLLAIQFPRKISQLLPFQPLHNQFHISQNTINLSRRRGLSTGKIIHLFHRSLDNPFFLFNSIFNSFFTLFVILLCSFFSSSFLFFSFLILFLTKFSFFSCL